MNLNLKNKPGGKLSAVILILMSSVCAFGLPFTYNNFIVSAALLGVTAVFLIAAAERRVSTALLLISIVSLFSTAEGITVVAIALSLIVGCGVFARALEKLRSPFLWAIPVGAFILSAVVNKNIVVSLLALGFSLPAAALSYSFTKKHARVGAICLASFAFIAGFTVFLLADIYVATGSISLSFFEETAELYRVSFTEILSQFVIMNPETSLSEPLFTPMEARNIASEIVSLFPAFFVIMSNIAAYLSQKLLYSLVRREGELHKFEDKMIALILSPFAGATFVLSFFVMIFASLSADHALAYTVSENIFYIFIPGLAASGIMFQLAKIAHLRRGAWIIIPFVILAFVNIAVAILLAAGLGAYYSIASPVYAYLHSHNNDEQ